jgi:hypothetical protein
MNLRKAFQALRTASDPCPKCGSLKAYHGFAKVECPTKGCANFTQQQHDAIHPAKPAKSPGATKQKEAARSCNGCGDSFYESGLCDHGMCDDCGCSQPGTDGKRCPSGGAGNSEVGNATCDHCHNERGTDNAEEGCYHCGKPVCCSNCGVPDKMKPTYSSNTRNVGGGDWKCGSCGAVVP